MVFLPGFSALFFFAVLVVQVATCRTGRRAQCGTGKGILVENGGTSRTGGYANGRASKEMLFLGMAGREGKGEGCDSEYGKEFVHMLLLLSGTGNESIPSQRIFCSVYHILAQEFCHLEKLSLGQASRLNKQGRSLPCTPAFSEEGWTWTAVE